MSFELLLVRFEAGNPVRIDAGALQPAFARHGIDRAAGIYAQTRDGLDFELNVSIDSAETDHDEVTLAMRGISPGLLELVYDLAALAKLTVVLLDDESRALVTDADAVRELPEEYATQARVCRSAEEMASAILPLFERWRAWAL